MNFYKQLLLTLLFSSLLHVQLPAAESYEELQIINKSGAFSLDGDIMVIGAQFENIGAESEAGAAYIYKRNAETGLFSKIATLVASDALTDDHFGRSVAVNGDTIVISSLGSFYGWGSTAYAGAYIFQKNNTTGNYDQIQKITDDGEDIDQQFAGSIGISGDTLIVGGSNNLNIYKRDNSTGLFNKLAHGIYNTYGPFDIDNNIIAVSRPNKGPAGDEWPYLGIIEMYELNASTGFFDKTATIIPSDAIDGDRFGTCLSLSGETIAVGLANDFYNTFTSNALYIFQYNTNTGNYDQTDKLTTGSSALSNDQLGKSVDLRGNQLITGGTDINSNGAAYIFERSNAFNQTAMISNVDQSFAYRVSISNDSIVVGAQNELHVYNNTFVECTGDRMIQGTTTCLSGDPVLASGTWIPPTPCGDGYRQLQGTTYVCSPSEIVAPPGIYLPRPECPIEWKPVQGTSDNCVEIL